MDKNDKFLHKFITFLKNEHSCSTIDPDHYQHAEVTREEHYIDVLIKDEDKQAHHHH